MINILKNKNRKGALAKGIGITFIVLMLALTYAPLLILVVYSFTASGTMGIWTGFTFDLYKEMFTDGEVMLALANSLIIGGAASLIATFLGTAAAVGIFYMRRFPKTLTNGIGQITMVNADIVTSVAFMLFFFIIKIIPDGYGTLIIAHTVICCPYVIMSVMPRLSQLNPNVYEAGLDLGASHLRTFFTVVMPQLISGMVAGFVLAFTISLDDFTISKFNNGNVVTIPTYLYENMKNEIKPVLRAMSTVLLVVIMLILVVINIASAKKAKKLAGRRITA